jgi:hypothetical protein
MAEIVMGAAIACALATTWLVFRERKEAPLPARGYWAVPAVCLLLYLTGERERGAIWPLAQRWVLVTALLSVPLLSMPAAARERRWAARAMVATAAIAIVNACVHFVGFDRETRGLDDAFAEIGDGKRVAMLAYRRTAEVARFEPFMHLVSYYQAERGGVVAFTFAGFDHWPFDFQRGKYPIWDGPLTPRWESFPEIAGQQPLDRGFDYLLVRDRDGRDLPRGFRSKWREGRWEVLENTGSVAR